MIGRVVKKNDELTAERIAGLNAIDWNGTKEATCTCEGEDAFYITGSEMGSNIAIGKQNDLGEGPSKVGCTRGSIVVGACNTSALYPTPEGSWPNVFQYGNSNYAGHAAQQFGLRNCVLFPRLNTQSFFEQITMVGRDNCVGNANNTNWNNTDLVIIGCGIKVDNCNLPEAQATNTCGCTSFVGNSDIVIGRNIYLNHSYANNPGRNTIVSGWAGRYCATDSVFIGASNVGWRMTSDDQFTGVVSVQCPYGSCTSACPFPEGIRGITTATVVGLGNRTNAAQGGIIVGCANILTSDIYAGYCDGTSNRACCPAANVAILGQNNNVWGEDDVSIGRANNNHGWRNYTIGTSAVAFGAHNVAIGDTARATFGGTATDSLAARTVYATAVGTVAYASGFAASAFGTDAKACASESTSIGHCSTAVGLYSTAVGGYAKARALADVVIGWNSQSTANMGGSVVIGNGACTTHQDSVAISSSACKYGGWGIVIGPNTKMGGLGSIAIGGNQTANGSNNNMISIGTSASASGYDGNIAIGVNALSHATYQASTVVGANSQVGPGHLGDRSTALGANAVSCTHTSVAIGWDARNCRRPDVTCINISCPQYGERAVAIGVSAYTCGLSSVSIGDSAKTYAGYTIAIGTNAKAGCTPNSSCTCVSGIAIGVNSCVMGQDAIGIGSGAIARDCGGIAIGWAACSTYGIAIGRGTRGNNLSRIQIGGICGSFFALHFGEDSSYQMITNEIAACLIASGAANNYKYAGWGWGVDTATDNTNDLSIRQWGIQFLRGWHSDVTCRLISPGSGWQNGTNTGVPYSGRKKMIYMYIDAIR